MFDFHSNENPILDATESIYESAQYSSLHEKTIYNLSAEIITVANFLGCSKQQAVLLSIMIHIHFKDEHVSMKTMLDYIGLSKSDAFTINKLLIPLVEKQWITSKQNIRSNPFTEYTINNKLIRSVLKGKLEMNEDVTIENSYQLIMHFKKKLNDRINNRITYKQFIKWTCELVLDNQCIELSLFINKLKVSSEDKAYFLYVCTQFYYGEENCDCDDIIKDFMPPLEEQYKLRNSFRNATNYLLMEGFLKENLSNDLFSSKTFLITEKAVRAFDKTAVVKTTSSEGLCEHLQPALISEMKMIFESKEQSMVNKLHKMLSKEYFIGLTDRLENQGMKKGISILLYGASGTGKTETVYQLAKTSNRCIMMADASKIRSKWVGETEKNMKALFDEYRKALNEYNEVPILMFNEADSILGIRNSLSDRANQTENVMQNILLQELEKFEGIFIATTNLVDNLDKAFDRRFLYKLRFDKPGANTVAQIWKSKFPDVPMTIIKRICSQISLSGGQIENIRKKVSVDAILDEKVRLTESYLFKLAQEENILDKKNHRDTIGFKR
jgi:ABC-type dipeptide/oligopeptide/nickel transport system ATPase subunit